MSEREISARILVGRKKRWKFAGRRIETQRVLLFSAASNGGVQDIAFPHQCEIKVNSDEVKANLRGLKNKPGSTRPVDITDYLRLKPTSYNNTLDFTYALTTKVGSRHASRC